MHSLVLITRERPYLKALLEEGIKEPCQVHVYSTLVDLYPDILSEEPLLMLIDGNAIQENELGAISLIKKTFPFMQILLSFPRSRRDLAAQSIAFGVDAYILDPFPVEEFLHFVRRAFENAVKGIRNTTEMRMKALSLFIQGLAPEINNRLTPIMGAIQLLMSRNREKLDMNEVQENLICMLTEANRIVKTVEELENFARPRRPKKNMVSIKETLEKAIQESRRNERNATPIENEFHATVKEALLDATQVITALGAVIRFLRETADKKLGRVEVTTFNPEPEILSITIEGFHTLSLGEDITHAFVPLYMKRVVPFSHELGLASAYGLVKAHKGTIKIESTSTGSRFVISLPTQ